MSNLATKVRASDDLDIKSVSDDGKFSGYLSRWNVVDHYRERVAPYAFREHLASLKAKGRKLPVLWQHRQDEPIGVWDVLKEDESGLYSEGTLWLDVAPTARLAHRGMKAGAITGLSVGIKTKADSYDNATRVRTLKVCELHEGSICTVPALDEARIDNIKAKLAAGELITDREFRRTLREKGFSHSQAEGIAALGFDEWARRETRATQANDPAELSLLARQLGGFSLPTF